MVETEDQLRRLAESARAAILVMDQDSFVLFANPAVEHIFGYRPDEVVGQPLTMLMPPEYRAHHEAGMRRFLATGERRIRWEGVELPGLHKDGRVIPLEITISDFEREGRRYFTGLAHDISARKAAERDREELLATAETALRSRNDVLAIVSHDLRSPLDTVMMASRLLETAPPGEQPRLLKMVQRAADRMNRLIQDLLDVVKLEGGQGLSLELTPVEVDPLVGEACEAVQAEAQKKTLVVECGARIPGSFVTADRHRVQQVLSNLLGNALKFTPAGGRVTVETRSNGDQVVFSVRDSGPGIPAEHLAHVFEPYWQMKKTGGVGAGLGLTISKGIVEAHGGRIWVESVPGQGTAFFFSLPRTEG